MVTEIAPQQVPRRTRAAAISPLAVLALLALIVATAALPLRAQDAPKEGGAGTAGDETGGKVTFFPSGTSYAPYAASPQGLGFAMQLLTVRDIGVADSSSQRMGLKMGGSLALVRFHPRDRPDRGWQLEFEAGFYGQFDRQHSYDNIGWDGIYGLVATAPVGERTAVKVGIHHISSHVGDEFAERTGRRRIAYTREELVAAVSRAIGARWRAYAEAGWAYDRRNPELQRPGRVEAGAELTTGGRAPGSRLRWFAGIDLEAMEERDWQLDASLAVGALVRAAGDGDRRWRLGLVWRDGRVPIGEFFQDDESYVGVSVWLDI